MNSLGNKEIFARNLKKYIELSNKRQKDICKDLQFSESTFSDWINAKSYPRIDKIEILSNYFKIDKSDLIEDKSDINNHSKEYNFFTDLCSINFKSVMVWSEDSFYKEYEATVIREHISDLLGRYKRTLEILNNSKLYWKRSKDELIRFYRDRDPRLSEKEIKEIFLKQELESSLEDITAWINHLPGWIARQEDEYEKRNITIDKENEN